MLTRKKVDEFLARSDISASHLRVVKIRLDGVAPHQEDNISVKKTLEVLEGLTELQSDFQTEYASDAI